jgi:hypothetical protein
MAINVAMENEELGGGSSSSLSAIKTSRLLSDAGAAGVAESKVDDDESHEHEPHDPIIQHDGPLRTLVVYSGPTSMDRHQDKNGMYIDNMNYFIEHGVSCFDDMPPPPPLPEDDGSVNNNDNPPVPPVAEAVIVNYAFVLTQEVADYYNSPHGPLTKKIQECQAADKGGTTTNNNNARGEKNNDSPLIRVVTRLDRCYDMESIRVVVTSMNVQALYDNILFINCGLVGPKIGPGSPKLIPMSTTATTRSNAKMKKNKPLQQQQPIMVPYAHWSQLYTSRLSDSVRLVGHSINTHFHTFFPHVQSFLYAIRTDTVPILLSSGAIYDCGLSQVELAADPEKRFELIQKYEVGMSTQLLKRGYKIGTAFVNRYGFGKSLVYDKDSTWGTELDDTISDLWYEDGIRNLTATLSSPVPKFWHVYDSEIDDVDGSSSSSSKKINNDAKSTIATTAIRGSSSTINEDTFDYHKYDMLPWEYFIFFKVSRLVPEDVQHIMKYDIDELAKSNVHVISNDPRKSPNIYWLKKTGVYVEPTFTVRTTLSLIVGCLVAIIGVLAKKQKRRISIISCCGSLSPQRKMRLILRRRPVHDHEK